MDSGGRLAHVQLDGWAGRISKPVEVIGETKASYRVVIKEGFGVRSRGGKIWRAVGEVCLVPKWAVVFVGNQP